MSKDKMSNDKKFCHICGKVIKENIFNQLVYPCEEFKEGYACFFCSKKVEDRNVKKKGLK